MRHGRASFVELSARVASRRRPPEEDSSHGYLGLMFVRAWIHANTPTQDFAFFKVGEPSLLVVGRIIPFDLWYVRDSSKWTVGGDDFPIIDSGSSPTFYAGPVVPFGYRAVIDEVATYVEDIFGRVIDTAYTYLGEGTGGGGGFPITWYLTVSGQKKWSIFTPSSGRWNGVEPKPVYEVLQKNRIGLVANVAEDPAHMFARIGGRIRGRMIPEAMLAKES